MKRIFTLVLTLSMILTISAGACFADATVTEDSVSVEEVSTPAKLESITEADVVDISKDVFIESDESSIKEILDNGAVFVLNDVRTDEELVKTAKHLDEEVVIQSKGELQQLQGVYISSDGQGGYNISEVIAEIVPEYNEEKDALVNIPQDSLETVLNAAVENEALNPEEIYYSVEDNKINAEKFEKLAQNELVQLQASSITANSFMDKTTTFNLYGYTGTTTVTAYSKVEDYYIKASSTKVTGYVAKVKTSGTTTYDAIYAVVTVDPTSKFKVIQYNTKLSTPSNTRYTILEGSELKTTSTSKTITLNASGGSDGISGGIAYSYTWKPNSQNITDNLGGTYNQWWKACPVDPSLGNSFTIKPSMIVKATSGTSSTIKTYVKLTYQKLKSPTLGTYKSDTDKTLTLKYKNHKEV